MGKFVRCSVACSVATMLAMSCGCAFQRAQMATEAREKMIGMTKEQVLACMGPPINKAAEGATEVWSYASGNGQTDVSTFGTASGGFQSGDAIATRLYCTINVTMNAGRVSRINYVGPTGGLLTAGEQCAFALQNCIPAQ